MLRPPTRTQSLRPSQSKPPRHEQKRSTGADEMYGDRIYQTDLRLSRVFRAGRTTVRPTVSIYNLFTRWVELSDAFTTSPTAPDLGAEILRLIR